MFVAGAGGEPPREQMEKTWHPSVGFKSILFGLLTGFGLSVLVQQMGIWPFTIGLLVLMLMIGVVMGIGVRSLGYAVGVAAHNRRVQQARSAQEDEGPEGT